uniref:Peptidase M24 domain-containing protein n=1 Tax=Ditylenchus dipsaci TaxID=166011 RepID=A0A915E8H3_9BILA
MLLCASLLFFSCFFLGIYARSDLNKRRDHLNKIGGPELFAENRRRLLEVLRNNTANEGSVVVYKGAQESYLFWTFGVRESDFYGVIDVDTGRTILFPLNSLPDYGICQASKQCVGRPIKKANPKQLLLLHAESTDSGNWLDPADFQGKDQFAVNTTQLYPVMAELRVFKTDYELEVLRYYEYQLESLFQHISYYFGKCRHMAYTCIAAMDLMELFCTMDMLVHLMKNNQEWGYVLVRYGTRYNCYGSDVTVSFLPMENSLTNSKLSTTLSGKPISCFEEAKPGVRWTDMHKLAEEVILTDLKAVGVVVGNVQEMWKLELELCSCLMD